MATQSLELYQSNSTDLKLWRPPEQVLVEAQQAAAALQKRIAGKKKPVIFNGEQYIELDDWEMVAHFFGYAPKVEGTEFVEFGSAQGFKAAAVLLNEHTGMVVSRAESMCLNDEDNWGMRAEYEWRDVVDGQGKKIWKDFLNHGKGGYERERVQVGEKATPLFQLLSMAQTRACAKVCRNKLAWIVVLAGYKPTPAEEVDGSIGDLEEAPAAPLPTEIKRKEPTAAPAQSRPTPQVARSVVQSPKPPTARVISEGQGRRFYAIWKGAGKTKDQVDAYLREVIGVQSDRDIPVERYTAACEWAESRSGEKW